jgi:hypothetical protein
MGFVGIDMWGLTLSNPFMFSVKSGCADPTNWRTVFSSQSPDDHPISKEVNCTGLELLLVTAIVRGVFDWLMIPSVIFEQLSVAVAVGVDVLVSVVVDVGVLVLVEVCVTEGVMVSVWVSVGD